MSIVVSTAKQICDNPLNMSKTKSLYSFPKSERFIKDKPLYVYKFYNLPPTINKRTTNLGYSEKYDFTKGVTKTPAPNKYELKTDIEKNINKKVGISFGNSREVIYNLILLYLSNKNLVEFLRRIIYIYQVQENIILNQHYHK